MAAIEYKWLSMSNFDIPIHLARMVMVEVDCEWVSKEFTLYLLWQDSLYLWGDGCRLFDVKANAFSWFLSVVQVIVPLIAIILFPLWIEWWFGGTFSLFKYVILYWNIFWWNFVKFWRRAVFGNCTTVWLFCFVMGQHMMSFEVA